MRATLLAGLLALLWIASPQAWSQSIAWSFTANDEANGSPAIGVDGTIYFGSRDGRLYAVQADAGSASRSKLRWYFQTQGEVISAPALASDETVYFGSGDGWLYAVQADPGSSSGSKLRWRVQTGGPIQSSPAVGVDGTIYVGSLDGKLYAVRPDGTKRWAAPFVTGGPIYSSPVVGVDGTIYVGSLDNRVYAVNPNGMEKWHFVTGGWVDSSPAIGTGGTIYVGSVDHRVYAINPNGTTNWVSVVDNEIYSSPAVGPDGTIYVAALSGRVYAFSPDGSKQWDVQAPNQIVYSSIAITKDGSLYVGGSNGQEGGLLHGSTSGGTNWIFTAIGPFRFSSPAIGPDGTIYIGSQDHKLYAISGGSAPAAGPWPMFRRDTRHTASGFVERSFSLPFYAPGLGLVVTLTATPPPGITFCKIEDTPPPGWTVLNISDQGAEADGTVRFGPFLDDTPRLLTYQVIPPLGSSGSQTFEGISFADGSARLVGGEQVLHKVPLHPADVARVDGWMTIGEVTTYLAAWKRGDDVPNDYLQRAIELWQRGEGYWFDTAYAAAPLWWTSVANPLSGLPAPGPLPIGTVAPNGTAIASMPLVYRPGTKLTVTIAVTPQSNVVACAVEDQPPAGWTVGAISDGGVRDDARGKVKWGPFPDGLQRTLTYEVTPPLDATNLVRFNGIAAFDGEQGEVGGQRILQPGGSTIPDVFAVRHLPPDYSPGATISVRIETTPLPVVAFWDVDETPPAGWTVSQIGNSGFFDAASGRIRFGPFFDGEPRTLTYQVTAPLTATGVAQFAGTFEIDFVPGLIAGDAFVGPVPLHPADQPLVDAWMTVGEVAAYGAAWKRNRAWPTGPSPILSPYLAQAINLWKSGEAYRYDPTAGPAPSWWVSLPASATPRYPAPPPPSASSALGTANCIMPPNVQPGTNVTVVLQVTPSTNAAVYAVEDQPPAGWAVSNITGGGFYDAKRGKVKWGPFFHTTPTNLFYSVTVPTDSSGLAPFAGAAAFDDTQSGITGVRAITVGTGTSNSTGSFVTRSFGAQAGYVPGQPLKVSLLVSPVADVDFVVVEEVVPFLPLEWHVDRVSGGGVYNRDDHTIRFGVYLDGHNPTTLTYEITPPLFPVTASGVHEFHGTAFANHSQSIVGLDHSIGPSPLHPGDVDPTDGWFTIGELTTYGAAWKRGEIWGVPQPPHAIQPDYIIRAVELWIGGEHYGLATNITDAPFRWVNTDAAPTEPVPVAVQPDAVADNGTAIASMPLVYQPGTKLTVTIAVTPDSSVVTHAVEDQPPAGWTVGAISDGGFLDLARGKVKWGPFFDTSPPTLSYEVTPPVGATNLVRFNGAAAFDKQQGAIGGQRFASPKQTDFFAVRHLPASYSPGLRMTVILDVNPPAGVSFYKIEDRVPSPEPELWIVSNVSHDGVAVEALGEVRFGPFLDDLPRRLTYELTPPLCVSGTKALAGIAYADGSPRLLVGDYFLDMAPLHPADLSPVDGWVTIGEATAYVTAWKVGAIWPCVGPDPRGIVRNDFLERAVELWLGGEHYGFDPAFGAAPLWWVNLTNTVSRQEVPIPVVPGSTTTSGTAVVNLPGSFLPGVPIIIRITATPGPSVSAYALEDQPPLGWTILTNSISEGGRFDALRGKVKWGPFSDNTPRTNSYQVIPPLDAGPVGRFVGGAAFDGQTADFIGSRETVRSGNPPPQFSLVRVLPGGLELTLLGGGGGVFTIQRSTDLIGWSVITNLPTSGGPVPFVDRSATNLSQSFYRFQWQ